MIQGNRIDDGRITVYTASGRLTYPEIRAKVDDLSTNRPTSKVLCDLTRATVGDLTVVEVEEIIALIGQRLNKSRRSKSAIVVYGSVDRNLARTFRTFSEIAGLPLRVKVFRTKEIATRWLQESDGSAE